MSERIHDKVYNIQQHETAMLVEYFATTNICDPMGLHNTPDAIRGNDRVSILLVTRHKNTKRTNCQHENSGSWTKVKPGQHFEQGRCQRRGNI